MKTKRNPSGKTSEELSRIYCAELLETFTPSVVYDSGIAIDSIFHLPMMAATDSPSGELDDLIDECEELPKLLGTKREIRNESDICQVIPATQEVFIVKARVPIHDFTDTKFDQDGNMDSCGYEPGMFVVYGSGLSLREAYKAIVEMYIMRQTPQIEKGLKSHRSK